MIGSLSNLSYRQSLSVPASRAQTVNSTTFGASLQNSVNPNSIDELDSQFSYDRITTSFDQQTQKMKTEGASDYARSLENNRTAYLNIIKQAKAQSGLSHALDFVKSLSATDLSVLQHTHNLADSIQTGSLTEEGALNLILPSNESRDLNHDGIDQVGAANLAVFPPHDAPQSVRNAWDQAIKGMDGGTVMTMQFQMQMAAGVHSPTLAVDQSAIQTAGPVSYSQTGFSWQGLMDRVIAGAEFNRTYESSDTQRAFGEQLRAGYHALKDAFTANHVA